VGIDENVTDLRRLSAPLAAVTALVVAVTLASVPASATSRNAAGPPVLATAGATSGQALQASQAAQASSALTSARPVAEQRKRRRYTPKTGVIHTDPRRADRRKLLEHIVKSIGSTRRKRYIRVISWNVTSRGFVDKLIAAHKRGVSVRLLMSKGKAEGNGLYHKLRKALRAKRPKGARVGKKFKSWARVCDRSCRGNRGIAHSKLFMFSKAGGARLVVMSTSANATEVAVKNQWNDLYTVVGSTSIYNGFLRAFAEASRDKPVRRGYREFHGRKVIGYVYPWSGKHARGDRVMKDLKRITCRGATGKTGINGRTRIRIAQDAIIDNRGVEIGKILRRKWEAGCNIRIVYALMGKRVLGIMRNTTRGPVPIQQIVNDWDGDGVYDRYLHSKVLAVSGWFGKDRSARISWQGSENWSGLAKISDEQGFQIRRGGAEGVYARWVDYLFNNPPPPSPATTLRMARARGVDPYALIKEELGLPVKHAGAAR
jgi:hypothetical protein